MMQPVEYYIEIRGNECENCHAPFDKYKNPATRHHCLIKRDNKKPQLDNEINIELAGWTCCHETGKLDTQEHKEEFAYRQIARGYDVGGWVISLPLKVKEAWLLNL